MDDANDSGFLFQAVSQYQKQISNEDRSHSSAGHHRFYNWNTTHFYPDVHKLDIGILFRHSNKFNRFDYHDRNSSEDDEPGYVSTSSSEKEDDRKRAQKDFAQKKMLLTQPKRSHIDSVGATRNGLGVKIDIDLDSGSNSDEDDRDKWHKSPVRLRRIRRQDGRPLSAEINYDAASKKLYIHTLSKKMDTSGKNGRVSEPTGLKSGKISRRLSSPGSSGSHPVRRSDRKTEKRIGESAQKHVNSSKNGSAKSDAVGTSYAKTRERRDFIKELGKLQGLDFYDETQERSRPEKKLGKRGDGVEDSSDLVSLHSGHLSRSQEDIRYIEPAHTEWQVLGELNDNQPKSFYARDRKIARELKSTGNSQSNTSQRRELENQSQTKNNFGVLQSGKSFGWHPRTGSSFENIYDCVGRDAKSQKTAQEMELNERKREKFQENQLANNRAMNVGSSELKFQNIQPSSFHGESKSTGQKLKNASKTNTNFITSHHKASPATAPLISQPQSGCHSNATPDQSKPRKLHIDAKTLMEEEKQKFEDYKIEYRRQWSGQESGDEKDVAKSQSVDESHVLSMPYIPPDDYVYILRKIHHTRQDALVQSEPQKTTSSGLQVDLHHQPKSDGPPLTRSDPELSLCGAKNGGQRRPQQNPANAEEFDDWAAKQKPIQLPSEIYLDRYEYNRNMVMPKDGRTSEENETDPKISAFQRIIRCSDTHHTDPASFDGNPIHSRRPDLIPSPMAPATPLGYTIDTKQSKVKEAHNREDPLPLSCRAELAGQPNSPDKIQRNHAGLLHKPPKPRKDEFSAGVGPKQWTYNTSYKPSTPPTNGPEGHSIFTKTSPGCSRDGQFPAEMNFESQGSAPRDVCRLPPLPPPPPPPPPSPPSTSMNVFRTLPEQYRLSIQEPSSAVTDSLITKNGVLPLYHKELNKGKVKIPQFPMNPSDKDRDPLHPPIQTYLTDSVLNKPGDRTNYKSGQRYDKATVFSITGFHKPPNDLAFLREQMSPQSPETTLCDSFTKHPSEFRDLDVNLDPLSFPTFNSDSLKQTQWTDAEKRRPFIWNDADKRRPIVDWPDLDSIPTEPEIHSDVHYQWPFEATFDPREQTPYDRNKRDLAHRQEIHDVDNFNAGVKGQKITPHEQLGYYSRPSDIVMSPARKSSPNQTDFSSPMSCQVRSSEFSQLKGHLSESGRPQVFYAVQIPSGQANTATGDEGMSPVTEPLPYPPRPSSRVPQYNLDPLLQTDSQASVNRNISDLGNLCDVDLGIEAQPRTLASSKPSNKQSGEFGKLVRPLMPHEEDRRVKGGRSTSQPDVWNPVSGSGSVQLKTVLENKLSHQKQLLSDEKTKEKTKAFQNQSKATAEYEKHINRSQESYKAKKMTSIESELDDLVMTGSLNLATSSDPKKSSSREETPNVVLPKQKSALELHLSSSFVKPSASAGNTPSEDLQRSLKREPFNIEVDIQPPRTADSPQVFGMSVRLSASQEQLAQAGPGPGDADDEMPHISITAIKAKLFGENEDSAKQLITGRQLPIHVDHQQSKQPLVKSNADVKESSTKIASNVKSRSELEDERLYDYVSYKDGLKKKRSKIYDQLTDFERTYEGLNFDDDAENDRHPPQNVIGGREFHPDPPSVKRLSITNLKLLTESQERLVPNSSLEYTKEWILTGKGPEFGSKSMEQRHQTASENDFRNPSAKPNSGIHPAENHECLANYPRKVIDDMAYRKYGQSSMLSAKSDPDLPFKAVPVGMSYPTVEPTRHFPTQTSDHCASQLITGLDNSRRKITQQKQQTAETPKELKKVQIETQINSYKSPPHFNHTDDQSEASNLRFMSGDGSSTRPAQPHSTRVSLRLLNRSSSFESSCREPKPEAHPLPPSGVAKLVELFELSQSAPDLTEANLFGESYTQTGDPKVTPKPKKQKTPKDVKLRSENRSRIRLLKVNADSGYVESESDSQSSSGPELQPVTSQVTQDGQMNYSNQQLSDTETQEERKPYLVQKLNFTGSVQATSSCEEVSKKSETPEERMRRLQKLREEWFKQNPEAEGGAKPMFGFDSRLTKKSTADSTQTRTTFMMPSAPVTTTTSVEQSRSGFDSRSFLPSANPPTRSDISLARPGKSLDSLDSAINSHESLLLPWQSQNVANRASSGANRRTNTRTEQTIGLDSVRGPEVQKTTINLSLSTPPAAVTKVEQRDSSSVVSRVSFPSVQLSSRDNLVKSTTAGPLHQPVSFGQSYVEKPTTKASTEYQAEDVKVTEKQTPSGFSKEREDQTFQQSSDKDRTITELKTEKMKVEPWQFEASKRFERTVDQPLKKSFEYESQEFHHKEQVLTDVDVKITKQHTQTRAERVFKVKKKHPESPKARASVARKDQQLPPAFPPALRQPSFIDRLDFSDGEMTDATDVTLDAMVGFNQARPSSPETLDFSDMEMSASAFPSSKHSDTVGGFYTRTTEVVQKSSDGSQKLQTMETVTRDASNRTRCSKQEPLPTREELVAKAQSEMKLYRKDKDRKTEAEQAERRRSIKELVDSFEVMTMPFMRTRQRSSEVRSEDVEGAMAEKGNTRKD